MTPLVFQNSNREEDMAVFFTGDTHFGSERTMQLSRRPFSEVSVMDDQMIKRWNDAVLPSDIVWHVGDFGNLDIAPKLNGIKCLIFGNYERDAGIPVQEYLDAGFHTVLTEKQQYINLGEDGEFCLCHEPSHMSPNFFNLFGHVHRLSLVKKYLVKGETNYRMGLNVGADCHDLTPVSVEVVKFYENAVLNHYDEEVFL